MQCPQPWFQGQSSQAEGHTGWQEAWGGRVTERVHQSLASGCGQGPVRSPHSIQCYLCWRGRRTLGAHPGERKKSMVVSTHSVTLQQRKRGLEAHLATRTAVTILVLRAKKSSRMS